jgi:hypothetical protein
MREQNVEVLTVEEPPQSPGALRKSTSTYCCIPCERGKRRITLAIEGYAERNHLVVVTERIEAVRQLEGEFFGTALVALSDDLQYPHR